MRLPEKIDLREINDFVTSTAGSLQLELLHSFRTGISLNVILTLERDRRTAGMWQAKSKPQAIVINERLKKVRFH